MWSESNWSVVLWVRGLWYWYHTGSFPQQWHFSQLQAHVEDVRHNPAQLVSTRLEEPGADPIWTYSLLRRLHLLHLLHLLCFLRLHLRRFFCHLHSGEGQIGAGGLRVGWGRWMNVRGEVWAVCKVAILQFSHAIFRCIIQTLRCAYKGFFKILWFYD